MKNTLKGFGAALCVTLPFLAQTPALAADQALVQRGAYLAKVGDCVACHWAPKGKPYAGGLPMVTPMGKIFATNITPDPEPGMAGGREQDFERARGQGVSKDGHNLYPAMPYPSYAKVSDDDVKALYAYFMKGVAPVHQGNRDSEIPFPLHIRWPLKLWNMVFLDEAVYRNKSQQDVEWNRGAYLVQGLGHCGSCHTPRGIALQEKALDESGRAVLAGGPPHRWVVTELD